MHELAHTEIVKSGTIRLKEYILVIEVTAPAIVLQRCDSPNLSMPALADGQVVEYLQTEREEVG